MTAQKGNMGNCHPSKTSRAVNIYIIYHATSYWDMRSDTRHSFWHYVEKSVRLKFKIMSIYMYISRFRSIVDLVHFVLAFEKSFLVEALLFQINLPLLEHFVDKIIGKQQKLLLIILSIYSTNTCNSD